MSDGGSSDFQANSETMILRAMISRVLGKADDGTSSTITTSLARGQEAQHPLKILPCDLSVWYSRKVVTLEEASPVVDPDGLS